MVGDHNKNASLDPHLAVRASECLHANPQKFIDAKFNVTTIFPGRTGRAGPTGARPMQTSDRY